MTSDALDRKSRQTLRQIFLIPLILGLLTAGELIFALVEDGVWDALSWVTLGIPIVLVMACVARGANWQPTTAG